MSFETTSPEGEDCKTPNPLKNYEFTPSIAGEELKIDCKERQSHRLFSCKYTAKALYELDFPKIPLKALQKFIECALKGGEKMKAEVGYVNEESDAQTEIKNDYQKGDLLVIIIEHDAGFYTMVHRLTLQEVEQSETELLSHIIKDLREEITNLKKEFEDVKKGNHTGECLGAWQSTANADTYYKLWNVPIVEIPNDLLTMENNKKDIVVSKDGVYHIFGSTSVTSGASNPTKIYVNDIIVAQDTSYDASGHEIVHQFNFTKRLKAKDRIRVYVQSPSTTQLCNNLTIIRLSGK